MNYHIELLDRNGLRVAQVEDTPLLEVTQGTPDAGERIRGLLPTSLRRIEPGYTLKAWIDGRLVVHATVTAVRSQWGDTKKLILERYIGFQEVLEVEAEGPATGYNHPVNYAYKQHPAIGVAKDLIQRTPGPLHYSVSHGAFPEGAAREYAKFDARQHPENELAVAAINEGQWVGAARIDLTDAYAKDGDTIAGLKVDGEDWPDLRMMLIDAEESALNSHAIARHPDVAEWDAAEYGASGYRLKAEAATAYLQDLIDNHGIDFIELNPHRNAAGIFDDRVDAYGRYLGLVYGGGLCYNAALVEQGLADVYLYDDGRYLAPELELKDFFSYSAPAVDSVDASAVALDAFQAQGRIYEMLAGLAYLAEGCTFDVDTRACVRFRASDRVDHVVFYDPREHAVELAPRLEGVANYIVVEGHPFQGNVRKSYVQSGSIEAYGFRGRSLPYFALSTEADADRLAAGLLADVAYPEMTGGIRFFHGHAGVRVGDAIELRGAPLHEIAPRLATHWGGRFPDRMVARVCEVTYRLTGRQVETEVRFTSLLRSVANPLSYLIRSQENASRLFEFRLDDAGVGLDSGFHLD
ncbi:MAG: thermonuclease family protein [Candidatus Hydrogenedentes bacterium]|nr:thermonuclease family protein [Candidatus Hydrogenedentota bacterium]